MDLALAVLDEDHGSDATLRIARYPVIWVTASERGSVDSWPSDRLEDCSSRLPRAF
jgi:hypothetical protein